MEIDMGCKLAVLVMKKLVGCLEMLSELYSYLQRLAQTLKERDALRDGSKHGLFMPGL